MLWTQNAIEWLVEVQKVAKSLRVSLASLAADEAVLNELRDLSLSMAGIQDALSRFAAIIEAAELAGDDQPSPTVES